jgi:multiple sugar transport system ATP-binding protein
VGANVALVSRQSERTSLKLGDAVGVEIDAGALLFFDKQGRAIREMQKAA